MLDVGWSELIVIGVVALIVVGPKDLPLMFRTLGRFTGKMRGMARDFQRAMDDAAKSSGVDDISRDLKAMTSKKSLGLDALENAASKFEKWDPVKNAAKPTAPAVPAAAKDPVAVPMGPATQALAHRQAQERTERAARASAARMAKAAAEEPVPVTRARPARKTSAKAGATKVATPVTTPVTASPASRKAEPRTAAPRRAKPADAKGLQT